MDFQECDSFADYQQTLTEELKLAFPEEPQIKVVDVLYEQKSINACIMRASMRNEECAELQFLLINDKLFGRTNEYNLLSTLIQVTCANGLKKLFFSKDDFFFFVLISSKRVLKK